MKVGTRKLDTSEQRVIADIERILTPPIPLASVLALGKRMTSSRNPALDELHRSILSTCSFDRAYEVYRVIFVYLTYLLIRSTQLGAKYQVVHSVSRLLITTLRRRHYIDLTHRASEIEEWLDASLGILKSYVYGEVRGIRKPVLADLSLIVRVANIKLTIPSDDAPENRESRSLKSDTEDLRSFMENYVRTGKHLSIEELASALNKSVSEAEKIRKRGLTVKQIAKTLYTNEQVVRRLEDGNPMPSDLSILRLRTRHLLPMFHVDRTEKLAHKPSAANSRLADYTLPDEILNKAIAKLLEKSDPKSEW